MPFLLPNQQHQSTEGKNKPIKSAKKSPTRNRKRTTRDSRFHYAMRLTTRKQQQQQEISATHY